MNYTANPAKKYIRNHPITPAQCNSIDLAYRAMIGVILKRKPNSTFFLSLREQVQPMTTRQRQIIDVELDRALGLPAHF